MLKRALDADPKSVFANRALAMFYLVRNKAEAAEPYLKTVAEISPTPEAKYALAEYYLRLRRFDDARAMVAPYRQGRQDLCRQLDPIGANRGVR